MEDFEDTFAVWRVVFEGGFPLSEVRRWDMEDVDRFNDWCQIKQDYSAAHSHYLQKKADEANRKATKR